MSGKLSVDQAEPNPGYYVIRMDGEGKAPTRRYNRRVQAHRSAEALARKMPGVPFMVVKSKTIIIFTPETPSE